jgi:hypothetical protein
VIGALPAIVVPASRPMSCPSEASGVFMLVMAGAFALPGQAEDEAGSDVGAVPTAGGAAVVSLLGELVTRPITKPVPTATATVTAAAAATLCRLVRDHLEAGRSSAWLAGWGVGSVMAINMTGAT